MEDRKSFTYRGWNVSFDPPPIPYRGCDWQATHPDFDGPEDHRFVMAGSRAAVQAEVDEWIADNETCIRDPFARSGCCAVYLIATLFALVAIVAIGWNVTYG